tara:strand:+ start:252 stop:2138 length:1887 start_codon:yes stop_codon:yes gene_type:complete
MNTLQLHIQFFRAISVLLVFFYHLKLEFFNFGYLGVDIFFVISGYVITSRLYNEILKTNKINFYSFFIRRIKRIFPVLFFIISIVLIFIIFFQPLDLLVGNVTVYVFTILGLSNFYYLFSKKDYFDNVFEDVFGHTWSLGVEEQFYLIFPFFLYILYKIFSKKNYQIFFLLIIILSGVYLTFKFSENLQLIFYSPIFRFWEFLLGSFIFIFNKKFKLKNSILSILSFIILMVLLLFDLYSNNFIAILTSTLLASSFILFYDQKNKITYLFENKYFVKLGNISYSFYLWHLPIIYFYDLYFENSIIKIPFIFFLTILLSTISYIFIEKKFRYKKFNLSANQFILPFLISLSAIFIFFYFIAFQKSYENNIKKNIKGLIYSINFLERKIDYSNRVIFYKININGNEVYRFCAQDNTKFKLNNNDLREECLKQGAYKNRLFFVEGNSHTANYIPMLNKVNLKPGDSIYYEHNSEILSNSTTERLNNLKKAYNEIVFVTNIENYNLNKLEYIKNKLENDIRILLLSTVPNLSSDNKPLKCFIRGTDCIYYKIDDFNNRNLINYFSIIKNFVNRNKKRVLFYNSYDVICSSNECYSYRVAKDKLSHRDKSHLTIEGSLSLEKDFLNFYSKHFN